MSAPWEQEQDSQNSNVVVIVNNLSGKNPEPEEAVFCLFYSRKETEM